jgi:hypothetical protein
LADWIVSRPSFSVGRLSRLFVRYLVSSCPLFLAPASPRVALSGRLRVSSWPCFSSRRAFRPASHLFLADFSSRRAFRPALSLFLADFCSRRAFRVTSWPTSRRARLFSAGFASRHAFAARFVPDDHATWIVIQSYE